LFLWQDIFLVEHAVSSWVVAFILALATATLSRYAVDLPVIE
jgi:hypothetical protein